MEIKNKINEQALNLLKKGQIEYNSLRNSNISFYGKEISLDEKKCIAMYLTIINDDNFFNKILKEYGYDVFFDLFNNNTFVEHYEEEFNAYFNSFLTDDYLELLILYLLDTSIIKDLNIKKGYSTLKIKIGIYEYLKEKTINTAKQTKKSQKVLTK